APDGGADQPPAAQFAATQPAGAVGERPSAPARELVATAAPVAATTGTLLVNVRHSDKTPAAGVTIVVHPEVGDPWIGTARCSADAAGRAPFDPRPAGRYGVPANCRSASLIRGDWGGSAPADVVAGKTPDVDLALPAGVLLSGIVVDPVGTPVAGALV